MGLSIFAFTKLQPLPADQRQAVDDGEIDGVTFYDNLDFTGRAEGVNCALAYVEQEPFPVAGMSYGRYANWRNWLAQALGYPQATGGGYHPPMHIYGMLRDAAVGAPFIELVYFSDCEGTIGPVVSAKLAKDFDDFAGKLEGDARQLHVYEQFRKGFHLAADGGAVKFT